MRLLVDGRILGRQHSGIKVATINLLEQLHQENGLKISYFNVSERCLNETISFKFNATISNSIDRNTVVWTPTQRILNFRCSNVPIVLTVHDLVWKIFPSTMHWRNLVGEHLFFERSVKRANHIVCVSNNTAKDLINYFPWTKNKISVVHHAAKRQTRETSSKLSRYNTKKPFALFVGTFEPRKNLERLFEAISMLDTVTSERIKFIFAGSMGWGGVDPHKLKRAYGLEETVEIIINPPDKELYDLYSACTFLMFPTIYEGFGLPVLEAYSAGKPALVSNNSALPEIAGNAGLLVDPFDSASIAAGLGKLINQPGALKRLAANIPGQLEKFSWENSASMMMNIFQKSLDEANGT